MNIVIWSASLLGFLLVSLGAATGQIFRLKLCGSTHNFQEKPIERYLETYACIAAIMASLLATAMLQSLVFQAHIFLCLLTWGMLACSLFSHLCMIFKRGQSHLSSFAGTTLLLSWGLLASLALLHGVNTL